MNAVTQTLGTPMPLSYAGLQQCFSETLAFIAAYESARGLPYGTLSLLFPKIGAARGGGDWNVIVDLINKVINAFEVTFNKPRPATLFVVDVEPADCR